MTVLMQPGKLVHLRGRDWVVLPSDDPELLVVKPLGGGDEETTGIYLPLAIGHDEPKDASFPAPEAADLGDITSARLLYDAARLAFRNGAGPFRALAKLSFRPRAYQVVPLVMALRQQVVRLLVADDVGVGKTVEALLLTRELLERRRIRRFAVICLPHLCDQWQQEIRDKLDIDAVIIRSSTQARLDRQIQGDTSVYEYYPYQVISVDYIKAASRRDVFIEQCPELVIVDEAHAFTRPEGATDAQQQRYLLLSRLAAKPEQHIVMLTATPHSGKPEEFQSLLGVLNPSFESLDLPNASQADRRQLARHFVQRKRADVERWLGEDTPFPTRETIELSYGLASDYGALFQDLQRFASTLLTSGGPEVRRPTKAHYWTALALLRGVMSSPATGVAMLQARLERLALGTGVSDEGRGQEDLPVDDAENPAGDGEDLALADLTPTQLLEQVRWTEGQRRQLREFARRLEALGGVPQDAKLVKLGLLLDDWLARGVQPVIFCRFIPTANYLGEQLRRLLRTRHPGVDVQVVTSEDPDDNRKDRIKGMTAATKRVLVATDCLSEGINLQHLFTGVVHYDLPWNPNRLEQREGRVDRFGQQADTVHTCLLYGEDNPIDGVVLEVLLRKVREIRRATGINVPFPENSQSIMDAIASKLLIQPDRSLRSRKDNGQVSFDFGDVEEARVAKEVISRKIEEAAEREKVSRSMFAQNAIHAAEIEEDLRAVDEAIGDPRAVEQFVIGVLRDLWGAQVTKDRREEGYHVTTANLPPQLTSLLPGGTSVAVAFVSPPPAGYLYLGRNHRVVEQLCRMVMANTLARQDRRAARAAVIRTQDVARKTTVLLFRCRNVIEQSRERGGTPLQVVAEEMLLWGWRGTPEDHEFLLHDEARTLLTTVRASSNLAPQARAGFLAGEMEELAMLEPQFTRLAEEQSKRLVAAHERFSALMDKSRFQVVYPVLPMDLLGIYVLLPDAPMSRSGQ